MHELLKLCIINSFASINTYDLSRVRCSVLKANEDIASSIAPRVGHGKYIFQELCLHRLIAADESILSLFKVQVDAFAFV